MVGRKTIIEKNQTKSFNSECKNLTLILEHCKIFQFGLQKSDIDPRTSQNISIRTAKIWHWSSNFAKYFNSDCKNVALILEHFALKVQTTIHRRTTITITVSSTASNESKHGRTPLFIFGIHIVRISVCYLNRTNIKYDVIILQPKLYTPNANSFL